MTLDDFIEEEKQRVALFKAYWEDNMSRGEMADGSPIWPADMESGEWDQQFMTFDTIDATDLGFTVEKIDGEWVGKKQIPDEDQSPNTNTL